MKKHRILSLALAMCLCLALLPVTTLAIELPKLPTPTGLTWGINRGSNYEEDIPGYANWSMTGGGKNGCTIQFYNVENETTFIFRTTEVNPYGSSSWFRDISGDLESGTYYFTIQWLGDGINYADSEVVRSENWEYTKPSRRLPAPPAPTWDGEFLVKLPAYQEPYWDNMGTNFEILYSATLENATSADQLKLVGDGWRVSPSMTYEAWVMEKKAGYYYLRCRMSSMDITQCQNSDWSPLSAAYYYAGGDDQIISSGTMGKEDQALEWKYNELGQISVSGDLAPEEKILVGCYDNNGRFTGVKWLDADRASAQIDPATPNVKLFWLGAAQTPLSPSVTVWGR